MLRITKQGNRRPDLIIGLHTGLTEEEYIVEFSESCKYTFDSPNQYDWNKLFGWSYGWHHDNSVRVGWRYIEDNDIQLTIYQYVNGMRVDHHTHINVPIGRPIKVKLSVVRGLPILLVRDGGRTVRMEGVETKVKWGYLLGMYFGGDEVAPHDIEICMYRLG
jgi:hypothetical protein